MSKRQTRSRSLFLFACIPSGNLGSDMICVSTTESVCLLGHRRRYLNEMEIGRENITKHRCAYVSDLLSSIWLHVRSLNACEHDYSISSARDGEFKTFFVGESVPIGGLAGLPWTASRFLRLLRFETLRDRRNRHRETDRDRQITRWMLTIAERRQRLRFRNNMQFDAHTKHSIRDDRTWYERTYYKTER